MILPVVCGAVSGLDCLKVYHLIMLPFFNVVVLHSAYGPEEFIFLPLCGAAVDL
jgi:hypothetical protein